jgi:histone acetyltransferase (RNA polymerase elongator complex component)
LKREGLDFKSLSALVETGLASKRRKAGQETEIAFYGGTFATIEEPVREALLEWGGLFVRQGLVNGLRISTRPDGISEAMAENLWQARVRTIELGVQSLDDQVLNASGRGHRVRDTYQALDRLRKRPFKIGAQIMLGLPGDDGRAFRETVKKLLIIKPDLVRIYPTLVFRDTALARWYQEGRYEPASLDEAVELCRWAVGILEEAGISVIRLGLQTHPGLKVGRELLAGPFHPSFGDLVRRELLQRAGHGL